MKVNLKEILKNSPPGTQNYLFRKLNEISRGIKENIPGTDPQLWILAYNLRHLSENLPVRRYTVYDENPKRYNLDETLLPYVKVVRAYARMTDAQKLGFRNEIQQPITHKERISSSSNTNANQRE